MKRFALALMLLTGTVATATSVDFSNLGGTLIGTANGLRLATSELTAVIINGVPQTGDLGNIQFDTGSIFHGSLQQGATFRAGGDFAIVGNASNPLNNGVIFIGSFDSPVVWSLTTLANGTHNYTLTGTVTGQTYKGNTVEGATIQLTINTGKGFFNGTTKISSGNTDFASFVSTRSVVPEPSSFMMLGTGLLSLGYKFRKHLVA